MNNAIKTKNSLGCEKYAVFDSQIDRYKTFAQSNMRPLPLSRRKMNIMLTKAAIYNIPAKVTHI
jgi:hypothetical protein